MKSIHVKICLLILLVLNSGTEADADAAGDQLPTWAASHAHGGPPGIARTDLGSPFVSLTASLTSDPINGPVFLDDTNFLNIVASFDRERIPERVVHAKGAGAHGHFVVIHDITRYTKAAVFSRVGLKTEVFARFSTVLQESGSADTVLDLRGFAVKFYTPDGVWDLLGLNTPIFPIRDPILLPSLIHSRKRNPRTHLPDANMFWDFTALRPETAHNTLRTLSDLGLPDGFRHMNGFGINAFKFINHADEVHYVKFHWISAQGIRNLTWDQAAAIAAMDPNYAIRDLYNSIEEGRVPKWTLYVQVITEIEAKRLVGAFDATRLWNEVDYPLRPVGELVLNRNPENFFAEVEQVAFDPGNLVPGIEQSPDRLLQGRVSSYTDTQRHRLGANFAQLPINRPRNVGQSLGGLHNYLRDGPGCLLGSSAPNYYPNSFGGPTVSVSRHDGAGPGEFVHGAAARTDSGPLLDNFLQATEFWNGLTEAEKGRLVTNTLHVFSPAAPAVRERVLKDVFANISHDLVRRLKKGLQEKGRK